MLPASTYGDAFCAALHESGIAAAEVSPDGAWLAVNARFCDTVGATADEVRGRSFADLLQVDATSVVAGRSPALTSDARLLKKDGSAAWIRSTVAAVREPSTGRAICASSVCEDRCPVVPVLLRRP
jgi:PAS domain S-box-containing protein